MKKSKNIPKNFSATQITLTAVMSAIICILGPLSIPLPFSPVPITLTNLAIYLSVCLLGWKYGTLSYLVYLVIGVIGFPVFSSFGSGLGKLLGPTGGYLIGFIPMSVICGAAFERFTKKPLLILGCAAGSAVNYILGTLWLAFQAHLTFSQALFAGVIPYIPGDLIKIIIGVFLGTTIKNKLSPLQTHIHMI